jgi:hypothetical protein
MIYLYTQLIDGYPSPLSDSSDMYFQNNGLWYRKLVGNATIDILTGKTHTWDHMMVVLNI